MRAARRRGQAQLLGLLAVIVIGLVLYLMFLGPRTGADGESRKSIAASSIDMAKEVELHSNISQIQQGLAMYRSDNEGRVPATLDEVKAALKFPAEMFVNPIDNKPLLYDATTGTVSPQPYPGMKPPGSARAPGAAPNSALQENGGAPSINIPNIPQSPAPPSGDLDAEQ
jgi:hypothetical protein